MCTLRQVAGGLANKQMHERLFSESQFDVTNYRFWPLSDVDQPVCLNCIVVLLHSPRSRSVNPNGDRTMRLISSLIVCLGAACLSACATDYVSQLSEPNFGVRKLQYTPGDIDPVLLMNGSYASKKLNGTYGSAPLGAVCLTDYRCSPQAQQLPSGWDP